MHCLLIFHSWELLAPKLLGVFWYRLLSYTSAEPNFKFISKGVFWYRLLSYTSTWDCSSMLNFRYTELQIPNTTNLLEGFNSQLKRALHNHNGLNEANKKKFIDGFINTKK